MIITYKSKKYEVLLDHLDECLFSQQKWQYRKGYAGRHRTKKDAPGNTWVHLHREVLYKAGFEIPEGFCVDHINRNKLDNRKENLRIVTRSENGLNVSPEIKVKRQLSATIATKAAALKPRTNKQIQTFKANVALMNVKGLNKHLGASNHASKKIINMSNGIIYDSVREAAEKEGFVYSTLKSRLNGRLNNTTTLRVYGNV